MSTLYAMYFYKGVDDELHKRQVTFSRWGQIIDRDEHRGELEVVAHIAEHAEMMQQIIDSFADEDAPGVEAYELVEEIAGSLYVNLGIRGQLDKFEAEFESRAREWYRLGPDHG